MESKKAVAGGRESLWVRTLLASTILAGSAGVMAEEIASSTGGLDEVIVTAQKRSENLQSIPSAVQALGSRLWTTST